MKILWRSVECLRWLRDTETHSMPWSTQTQKSHSHLQGFLLLHVYASFLVVGISSKVILCDTHTHTTFDRIYFEILPISGNYIYKYYFYFKRNNLWKHLAIEILVLWNSDRVFFKSNECRYELHITDVMLNATLSIAVKCQLLKYLIESHWSNIFPIFSAHVMYIFNMCVQVHSSKVFQEIFRFQFYPENFRC